MDKPDEGAVKPSNADASVTAEMKQEIQKVVMGIFKEAVPRLIQKAVSESIPAALDQIAEKAIKEEPADPGKGNPADAEQKLTLKALNEQIAKLTQGIESERKARTDAENQARDIRRLSEVESHFARHLGADSPHLKPYLAHYSAQFSEHEGKVGRKTQDQYGVDQFVPLKDAVDELFKSELKHLTQQSRVGQLPGVRPQANGFPVPREQPKQPGLTVMQQEHYEHMLRSGQNDQAASYANAILGQQNGTAQK